MKPAAVAALLLLLTAPTRDTIWPKLPAPQRGEWRWRHHEDPQTLAQYRNAEPKRPGTARTTIYLAPNWTRPPMEPETEARLAELCAAFFGRPVKWTEPVRWPKRAYDPKARKLHIAPCIPKLVRALPDDGIFLLALTDRDLRLPRSRFTYGWGSLKHRVGIASTWRIAPDRKPQRKRRRLYGLVLHEATHTLSVPHCTERRCLMNGSLDLEESDRRPLLLCWECRAKLCWNLGLDPRKRYEALAAAWARAGFPEAVRGIREAMALLPQR
ncbi:MAG: archaemetzincin [Planctomycetota bacterium]